MNDYEQEAIVKWSKDAPADWLKKVFDANLWDTQRKIIESFRDNRVTIVLSCHAAGKSFIAAHAMLWAVLTHPYSKAVSTATTWDQTERMVWGEMRAAFDKHMALAREGKCPPLGVQPLNTELKIAPTWQAYGLSSDRPGAMQGIHAQGGVFFVVDEGDGIPPERWAEIKSNMSTSECHLLVIGNPVNPTSEMAKMAKNTDNSVITISAFNTPNFTSFGIVESDIADGSWKEKITGPYPYPYLVTPDYASFTYNDEGPDSIAYQSRVLARYPESAEDSLVQGAWLQAAFDLWPTSAPTTNDRPSLGLDVARYGSDQSVVAVYRGKRLWVSDAKGQLDSEGSAALLLNRAYLQHNEVRQNTALHWNAIVDVAGVGAGVYDILKKSGHVTAMDNAQKAKDPDRFINARAENYWQIREALRNGEIALNPHDRELNEELGSIRYKVVRSKIQIEAKDEVKKRLKRSPDRADACVLAYACGGEKNAVVSFLQAMGRRR